MKRAGKKCLESLFIDSFLCNREKFDSLAIKVNQGINYEIMSAGA